MQTAYNADYNFEDTWPHPSLEEPGKSPGEARTVAKSAP